MFKHQTNTEAQTSWAAWQGSSPSHTRLAETIVTMAVIAYFATFLLAQLLFP
jgi:hypothetical protein